MLNKVDEVSVALSLSYIVIILINLKVEIECHSVFFFNATISTLAANSYFV